MSTTPYGSPVLDGTFDFSDRFNNEPIAPRPDDSTAHNRALFNHWAYPIEHKGSTSLELLASTIVPDVMTVRGTLLTVQPRLLRGETLLRLIEELSFDIRREASIFSLITFVMSARGYNVNENNFRKWKKIALEARAARTGIDFPTVVQQFDATLVANRAAPRPSRIQTTTIAPRTSTAGQSTQQTNQQATQPQAQRSTQQSTQQANPQAVPQTVPQANQQTTQPLDQQVVELSGQQLPQQPYQIPDQQVVQEPVHQVVQSPVQQVPHQPDQRPAQQVVPLPVPQVLQRPNRPLDQAATHLPPSADGPTDIAGNIDVEVAYTLADEAIDEITERDDYVAPSLREAAAYRRAVGAHPDDRYDFLLFEENPVEAQRLGLSFNARSITMDRLDAIQRFAPNAYYAWEWMSMVRAREETAQQANARYNQYAQSNGAQQVVRPPPMMEGLPTIAECDSENDDELYRGLTPTANDTATNHTANRHPEYEYDDDDELYRLTPPVERRGAVGQPRINDDDDELYRGLTPSGNGAVPIDTTAQLVNDVALATNMEVNVPITDTATGEHLSGVSERPDYGQLQNIYEIGGQALNPIREEEEEE